MSDKIILLTGASGSLGAMILEKLIEGNWHVNVILRSFARSKPFLEERYPEAVANGSLIFTEIPDMSTPGVFDEPLSKAYMFLHIATPIAYSDFDEKVFKPAKAITENIFSAATKSSTLKRIVITGSIVATARIPNDLFSGRTISNKSWNEITFDEALEDPLSAYQYSKTIAEKQVWKFIEEEKPKFDVIYHLSPAIIGRNVAQDWKSTKQHMGGMSALYKQLDTKNPDPVFPYFMDMDDVAWMHVKSLDLSVPGNKRYLAVAGTWNQSDLAKKIKEEYPSLKDRVLDFPENEFPDNLLKVDVKETDEVFGTNWKSWWDSSKLTIEDILTTEKKFGIQEA